ncbi:hypothetical protein PSTT_01957 [Puccinia striiformis]|uniref:Uncharacterized protein n=1 Tax=Puccinia striiformis TaxID=27350 RepID=A0A2S4W1V7_9BASI|nr:hypothetical protein PSTT_01957 [Puccinia striiformis]
MSCLRSRQKKTAIQALHHGYTFGSPSSLRNPWRPSGGWNVSSLDRWPDRMRGSAIDSTFRPKHFIVEAFLRILRLSDVGDFSGVQICLSCYNHERSHRNLTCADLSSLLIYRECPDSKMQACLQPFCIIIALKITEIFEAVRHLASFLRYHFICGRIVSFIITCSLCHGRYLFQQYDMEFMVLEYSRIHFYTHSVWLSDTGKMRIFKIPVILIVLVLLNLCLYSLFIVRMLRIFKVPSFVEFGENWLFHRRGQVIQLVCGTILTLIKAYDLSRSDEITKVLATKNDPLGCAWGVLCLLCQTAVFPTVFDAISLWQNGGGMVTGAAYTTLSISAQFHLLGPLLAISAALDEDEVIDLGTPCTVEVGDVGVRDTCGKHITFEQTDKELRESKGPAP